jgi:ABC-type multidrug transport system ATPase subunit
MMKIELENVSKRYSPRIVALRNVNLSIEQGMFGLLGPNGAGKTTMLRMLATLIAPSSGRILINNHDLHHVAGRKAVRQHLGYLPQDLGLYPDLSAEETLEYFALLKGLYDRSSRQRQITQLLDIVGLSPKARQKVGTFSGGMKRRLGIAQALLGDPHIIIVDEPTAGLDPEERIRLRRILSELALHRIILLSTHVVEDIGQTCDTLAILDKGEIIFHGRTQALLEAAKDHTWDILSQREVQIPPEFAVMSMLPHEEGFHYHVVGEPDPSLTLPLQPARPTLEDSYVYLRQQHLQRQPVGRKEPDTSDKIASRPPA